METNDCNKSEVVPQESVSSKDWLTLLLLSIFLGTLGIDRFYVGKVKTGIFKLLISVCSLGMLAWIWWVIDVIYIACGRFRDSKGGLIKSELD